jgi:hypothetical protein
MTSIASAAAGPTRPWPADRVDGDQLVGAGFGALGREALAPPRRAGEFIEEGDLVGRCYW